MDQLSELTYGAPLFDVVPDLLADAKAALLISGTSQDTKLSDYIAISLDLIGRYTNRILVECEVTGRFSSTVTTTYSCYPAVYFPVAPVFRDAFVSVAWTVPDTADEVLEGFAMPYMEQGLLFITTEPANASLGFDACACNCNGVKEIYPIKAVIKAGYPEIDGLWSIPDSLRRAVVMLATYFYENPTDCGGCGCTHGGTSNGITLPKTVSMLADLFKIRRVF